MDIPFGLLHLGIIRRLSLTYGSVAPRPIGRSVSSPRDRPFPLLDHGLQLRRFKAAEELNGGLTVPEFSSQMISVRIPYLDLVLHDAIVAAALLVSSNKF